MKTIMLGLTLLLTISVFAQNGGQFYENNSVKIRQLVSNVSGKVVVEVTNKQTCSADLRLSFGNESRVKNVVGLGTDTFQIVLPANGKVKLKTETNCGSADFGQVELILIAALPISYVNVSAKWLDKTTVQLIIKVGEVTGKNLLKIQIKGKSGLVYKPIFLQIDEAEGSSDKAYTVILKYNSTWIIQQKTIN